MAARPRNWAQADEGRDPRSARLEELELIRRVQDGQTEAYGLLVRKYQDRVYNACWRICGNPEDARDLTQDAFLKALESLDGFRRQSGFYTWVFRIAVNLALTHRRDAARRRCLPLDGLSDAGQVPTGVPRRLGGSEATEDPVQRAGAAELHALLLRALAQLDDDHRAVVVLRDIEGFDYRQIAEILQIPAGTVKSRLHRARAALCQAVRPAMTGES